MALIKCPECGKEISDKATTCPNCGCPTSMPKESPMGNQHQKGVVLVKSKKTILYIIVAVVAIIFGGLFMQYQKQEEQKAAREEYISNLHAVSDEMLSGAAASEDACNLVRSVWYNAIFEKSSPSTDKYTKISDKYFRDFNRALDTLYSDDEFSSQLGDIRYSNSKVSDYMSMLSSPPADLEKCYSIVSDAYDSYSKLTNLALSPTGSLETYTDSFSSYDSDFMASYRSLESAIPSE